MGKHLRGGYYDDKQREFLDFVLSQYVKEGEMELDQAKLPNLLELKYHAVSDATERLGSITSIRDVFMGFQQYLYGTNSPT
jgi:type I restriction enzyme R subunit